MPRLVVFDLDETLVHATTRQLPIAHLTQIDQYFVYERPYARRLLDFTAARFDVGVWSSSSDAYIQHVLSRLLPEGYPLKFAWSVDRCVQRPDVAAGGYVYIKDLRKLMRLGYDTDEVVIVDDSPEKIPRQTSVTSGRATFHRRPFGLRASGRGVGPCRPCVVAEWRSR